ncbi:MAG: RidA family protein [Alphaproteobacteria bacterium]|nr:RidA family protein [Alphaproteobacteria bacterium]
MTGKIDKRLRELKIDLPAPSMPRGNYVPYVVTGTLVFLAGQLPGEETMYIGRVGDTRSAEQARIGARQCGLNLLAQLKQACGGDLDRVARCVKVNGYVNAIPEFTDHPLVINGTSDLFVEIFGEAGKHARAAVGAGSLPRGAIVEVEAVFKIR